MRSAFRLVICISAACLLVACGGGGDGGSSSAPVNPLARYAGTYAACDFHERETATVTVNANGSLLISFTDYYYANRDCTGALLATAVYSAAGTFTYVSTESAPVTGVHAGTVTLTIDKGTFSAPQGTIAFSGPGVQFINGAYCVVYGLPDPGSVCFGSLTTPADSAPGGLYLNGADLYPLYFENGVYGTNGKLTRVP